MRSSRNVGYEELLSAETEGYGMQITQTEFLLIISHIVRDISALE